MNRILNLATVAALTALTAMPAFAAEDWREGYKTVKVGFVSAENQKDLKLQKQGLADYLSERLDVQFEIFTAASYDGIIQGLTAEQIDFAFLGSSAYAAAWTESNGNVEPLVTLVKNDGTSGYFSIIVTRCGSEFETLEDLKGQVHAFSDPDSTSGYAIPYFNMIELGLEPDGHFKEIVFAGSHETGVQGVVNGVFSSASTWMFSEDDSLLTRMVKKGMIEDGEACVIWKSPKIPGDPIAARKNIPEELRDGFKQALLDIVTEDPDAWNAMNGGIENNIMIGYNEVSHDEFQWIIDMRAWLKKERRK